MRANWLMRRYGPRCDAPPPWRLIDALPCIRWRNHHQEDFDGAEWHTDGNGYIWNDTRWLWRGPIINLADVYRQP